MKKLILVLIATISTIPCVGQSLFFDHLNHSTWKSESYSNISEIKQSKDIGLSKLTSSKDSLKVNITVWTFVENELEISYYDHKNKTNSVIVTCKYEIDINKGVLKLYFDNDPFNYKVGINSIGNYALLSKKKKSINYLMIH